ncbi:MAG TPA: formimidoylglutamate deiminase [Steroidobacteraceae bacterium]|nr:formimidoylglutamate deiminase [Steroidobacteraceae bacterium]
MSKQYLLDSVLLRDGWARQALVTVTPEGLISHIDATFASATRSDAAQSCEDAPRAPEEDAAKVIERISGYIVPGMANGHSHAFQRGMAGNTEYRLSARDSFWTWRQAMYALANRITPADLEVLSTQLFVEMLKSGYTSVAEFHYLHRAADGTHYAGSNELWDAITRAAETTGIGLTFLPALYQTSDFGSQPLKPEQARFAMETERFLRAIDERVREERARRASTQRTGAAFHSLRAVPLESLREAVRGLRAIHSGLPLHIHIAEQVKEVDACLQSTGRRPIELLLDTGLVDEHWCLVHATHATPAELESIAASGAAVCVSISTEANLGDGFFDAARFLSAGGRVCVGSDSQATVCPAEELRWMEYQGRLRKKRRAVLADEAEAHVGTRLWRDAARHGAAAIGQSAGSIAVGARADWVVLDGAHPSMAGATPETALDHVLFSGGCGAIRDVMVAGRWVVRDRRHAAESALAEPFRESMDRLRWSGRSPARGPSWACA